MSLLSEIPEMLRAETPSGLIIVVKNTSYTKKYNEISTMDECIELSSAFMDCND